MTQEKPSRLSISTATSFRELDHLGPEVFRVRELHARQKLGSKFMETLEVDQPVTVRLRIDHLNDHQFRNVITALDLQVMRVETMRVVMRELEPPRVEAHRPSPAPAPKTPGVFGRLWNGWKKHVDQCRESLGG